MKKLWIAAGTAFALATLGACEQQGSSPPEPGPSGPTITAPAVEHGPNWKTLEAIKQPVNAFNVSAILDKQYAVGDALQFKVRSARDGYVHIVQVDSADSVSAMLPHEAFAENRIEAGQEFTFPPSNSNIKIRAQEPLGESLLVFAITRENLPTDQVFPELFGNDPSKGLAVVSADGAGTAPWSMARYTVNVVAEAP